MIHNLHHFCSCIFDQIETSRKNLIGPPFCKIKDRNIITPTTDHANSTFNEAKILIFPCFHDIFRQFPNWWFWCLNIWSICWFLRNFLNFFRFESVGKWVNKKLKTWRWYDEFSWIPTRDWPLWKIVSMIFRIFFWMFRNLMRRKSIFEGNEVTNV